MSLFYDAIFYLGLAVMVATRILLFKHQLGKQQGPDPLKAKFKELKEWGK